MIHFLKRSFADVNMDHLLYNVTEIRRTMRPDCMMMAVIKANAYGHGDTLVAREFEQAGVNWFGISNIEEALHLRRRGSTLPILVFGYTPPAQVEELSYHGITQTLYSTAYAKALSEACVRAGVTIDVHVKVDTGMRRLGFHATDDLTDTADEIMEAISLPGFRMTGIFTHNAVADSFLEEHERFTDLQFERFMEVVELLRGRGIDPGIRHCCNSALLMRHPERHLDMVRAGIILYGIAPTREMEGGLSLRGAMTFKAVVAHVQEVGAGEGISYGLQYHPTSPRRIATVTVGYADGYMRTLSNRARVLIRGQYAPQVGIVCMDQMMVDVTDIPDVTPGDEVVLFGRDDAGNEIPVMEMADLCGTIPYEIICHVGSRVPRVYYKNGRAIGVEDYVRIKF